MSGNGFVTPQTLAGLPKETPVLLAFSGGADSRALLHMLAERAKTDGFVLTLAHVNHGIRGAESLRDCDFCMTVAASYGLEICILDADVPTLATAHGRGLEEEARIVRYAYFERLMQERKIPLLATAHHADDNLETVLFHLCRGTGLSGLCGIAPTRRFGSGMLTRPLLQTSRRDILQYCEDNGLEYVTDSTNADTAYARNSIRNEVIPILGRFYDDLPLRTARMTDCLREDEAFLSSLAEELLKQAEGAHGLLLRSLRNAAVPIRTRALMQWIKRETGHAPERVHVDAVQALIDGKTPNAEVALPVHFCAAAEFGYLCAYPRQTVSAKPFCIPFAEGQTRLADTEILICVKKNKENTKINNLSTESYINLNMNFDIMKSSLFWRSYRAGDRLLQGGMHKKLRRLYGEAQIPIRWRARLPLLCDGEGIVWAPFVGGRDGLEMSGESYRIGIKILSPSKERT